MLKHITTTAKKVHHHTVGKPHAHLMAKGKAYATWHTKKHHHKVHLGIASVWAMIAIVGALGLSNVAKAIDTFTQSDWSGGVGTSTVDEYFNQSGNIDASVSGELSLDALAPTISDWCSTANCDNNWTKRKQIFFQNNGGARTDYQVYLAIPYDAAMRADFGDLRFTNAAGDTDLPYYIDHVSNGVSARVYVKTDIGAGGNFIRMYYGNGAASGQSDGEATMDFFDEFDGTGTLDPTKWDNVNDLATAGVGLSGDGAMVVNSTTTNGINIIPSSGRASVLRNDPAVFDFGLQVNSMGNNGDCNGSDISPNMWTNSNGIDNYTVGFSCQNNGGSYSVYSHASTADSGDGGYPGAGMDNQPLGQFPVKYRVGLDGANGIAAYNNNYHLGDWVDLLGANNKAGSQSPLNFSFYFNGIGTGFRVDKVARHKSGADLSTPLFGITEFVGGRSGWLTSATFDTGTTEYKLFNNVHIVSSGSGGEAMVQPRFVSSASDNSSYDNACSFLYDGTAPSVCNNGAEQYLKYAVFISAEDGSNFKVEDISIDYTVDGTAPTNPTITMAEGSGGQAIPNGGWTNLLAMPSTPGGTFGQTTYSKPYFEWSGAADNVGGSGVLGYCIYFGRDDSADPLVTKGSITTSSPLDTNGACPYAIAGTSLDLTGLGTVMDNIQYNGASDANYYLRIRTIDAVYNPSVDTEQFEFKLDTVSPLGFTAVVPGATVSGTAMRITWPTSVDVLGNVLTIPADNLQSLFGGPPGNPSDIAGIAYCVADIPHTFAGHCVGGSQDASWYKANGEAPVTLQQLLTSTQTGLIPATSGEYFADLSTNPAVDFNGLNIIQIMLFDNAGNITNTFASGYDPSSATFVVFNNTPPSAPQNLVATPTTNNANSFAFSWDAPSDLVGLTQNANYCWSANVLPDANNCTFAGVGVESLSADAYATQPGLNTMYVVAKDEAGNIDYANYASATFTANTSAPGAPRNLEVIDASNKATSTWKLALSWDVPLLAGSGVDKYKIFRSVDDITYTEIGSTTATSFVDAGLSQVEYYYKIKACDNANNCGLYSDMDSLLPTGRYTDPANLVSGPQVVDIKTRSARIQWSTDRVSDTKVAYGTSSNNYQAAQAYQAAQVTSHSIELSNLQPGTTYYYRARWTDDDGNTGQSAELQFKTQPAPVVSDASISNINLSSATLGFTTQAATRAKIYYGTSTAFGSLVTVNTSTDLSSYTTQLSNLADGTKYFYRINTVDSSGYEYDGSVASFTTLPRPRIENLVRAQIEGEPSSTQKITWTTNVPASSEVAYSPTGTPQEVAVTSELKTQHEMIIRGLSDDTQYTWIARSRDALGNVAVSDPQEFRTALDTRPPKAFDINTESSIRGTGAEARGQIIVTWKTDEPSTSQVSYGVGAGSSATTKTAEDARLTTDHIVIISDLSTSSVYNVQAISADKAGNKVVSTDQSVVVGRGTDNIFSIIFGALQKIFGVEL